MIMDRINKKRVRHGYTTGTCAAAAVRAAAEALFKQSNIYDVRVGLPDGQRLNIFVKSCVYTSGEATCSIIKDAGDDPDITHGIEIFATVRKSESGGINILAGKGIGTVTKPGLDVNAGMPAINPIPKKMIYQAIEEAMAEFSFCGGLDVIISAPAGEKLAARTLNPRLGIVGGISILGTSGIVIPYSTNAYKACISKALDVARACGCSTTVLTTGRRSEKFAQNTLHLAEESYIQVGDYMGYALLQAAPRNFEKIIIWGMIGKISKLANNKFYTHVSESHIDFNFLMQIARDCGVPEKIITELEPTVTARHFYEMLPANYKHTFSQRLCTLAAVNCSRKIRQQTAVECILSNYDGAILGRGYA